MSLLLSQGTEKPNSHPQGNYLDNVMFPLTRQWFAAERAKPCGLGVNTLYPAGYSPTGETALRPLAKCGIIPLARPKARPELPLVLPSPLRNMVPPPV